MRTSGIKLEINLSFIHIKKIKIAYTKEKMYTSSSRKRSVSKSLKKQKQKQKQKQTQRQRRSSRSNRQRGSRVRLSGGAECVNLIDPITQESIAATIPLKYRIEIPTGRVTPGGVILVYCYDIRTLAQSFHINKKNPLPNLPFSEDEDLLVLRRISELLPGVSESNVETVRILKTFRADIIGPRPRDEIGNTPVVRAIMNKKFKLARALLQNPSCGSVNDMVNENQLETLLTWSIARAREYNDFEAFNFLLQNGADVNKRNISCNLTPLMEAAIQNPEPSQPVHLDVIRALCERGADIEAVSTEGYSFYTVLAYLSTNYNDTRDSMQYLLNRGVDLHGGEYYNSTGDFTIPLYQYLSEQWIQLVDYQRSHPGDNDEVSHEQLLNLKQNALFIYEKFGVDPNPEFVSAEPFP